MTVSPTRATCFAIAALVLSPLVAAAPAVGQYDRRYEASSGDAPERYEARPDDGGGFLGSLFGRNERARRDQGYASREQGQPQYAQGSPSDLMVRLDRLENQIRQLTGAIEQLQYRNQQLEQMVRRGQDDGDRGAPARRPQAAAQPSAQPAPPPAAGAVPGRRSDVFDPAENPHAPGAPQTLGSIPSRPGAPPPIVEEEPQVGAPGGRSAGAPLDLGTLVERGAGEPQVVTAEPPQQTVAVPAREPRMIPGALPPPPPRNPNATGAQQQVAAAPTATPRDEFALAQGYIQRRDYSLAEDSLREFLKKYPSDRLVPEAHYWLGESLYQRQRFRDAAESFLTVSTKFERSGRAPDSLLRLGQSLAALGEREAACATLGEVVRKYPKASVGVKQSVEREQKRVRC